MENEKNQYKIWMPVAIVFSLVAGISIGIARERHIEKPCPVAVQPVQTEMFIDNTGDFGYTVHLGESDKLAGAVAAEHHQMVVNCEARKKEFSCDLEPYSPLLVKLPITKETPGQCVDELNKGGERVSQECRDMIPALGWDASVEAPLQQGAKPPDPPRGFIGLAVENHIEEVAATPKTIHEWAISQLRQVSERQRKNFPGGREDLALLFDVPVSDGRGTIRISPDGHVELEGISAEDALLLVTGELSIRAQKADEQYLKQQEDLEKSMPPGYLKAREKEIAVITAPMWDPTAAGDTNCGLGRIRLVKGFPLADQQRSMIHEMMHVATNCSGDLKLHQFITNVSSPFLKLLQDNPEMAAYLMKKPVAQAAK